MSSLDLEHRLSAIETAIAVLASREKPLLDLLIDVLEGQRERVMSNHLRTLGEGQDKNGRPALGLIASRKSPFDAREVVVRMTPKGHALGAHKGPCPCLTRLAARADRARFNAPGGVAGELLISAIARRALGFFGNSETSLGSIFSLGRRWQAWRLSGGDQCRVGTIIFVLKNGIDNLGLCEMRKIEIRSPLTTPQHEALAFFALSLDEQLHDWTDDSYKAPALNTFTRTLELEVVAQKNHSVGISRDALTPFIDELKWSVAKDPALSSQQKALCYTHLESMNNEKSPQQDKIARGVSGMRIVLGNYFGQIILKLQEILKEGPARKGELTSLAATFIVQAETFGFPRRHTFHVAQNALVRRLRSKSAFDPMEAFGDFIGHFPIEEKAFDVMFICEGDFEKYPRLLDKFSMSVTDVFPGWENRSPEDELFIASKSVAQRFLQVAAIKSRSPAAAHIRAQSRVKEFEAIVRFHAHKGALHTSALSLVYQLSAKRVYRVRNDPDPMHRWVSYEQSSEDAMLDLYSVTHAGEHLKQHSTHRMQRAVRLHRSSLKSNSAENQLIGLWASLEGIVAQPGREAVRIDFFAQCLLPALVLTYPQKLFVSAFADLKRVGGDSHKVLDAVPGDDKSFSKFIRTLLCDEHIPVRNDLCIKLAGHPLLLNRLFNLAGSFANRNKIHDTLRDHRGKVRWHLSRIYHTRNSIMHEAVAMPYLPTLVENLHVYVDTLIRAIQKTAMISPEHLTIEGALQYLTAWESYRLQALKNSSNEKLKDEDVWGAVFGEGLTLAPDPDFVPAIS